MPNTRAEWQTIATFGTLLARLDGYYGMTNTEAASYFINNTTHIRCCKRPSRGA